jgi:hypothetical protein
VAKEVAHAWDKFPSFGKGNLKRDEMYKHAVGELKGMFKVDTLRVSAPDP